MIYIMFPSNFDGLLSAAYLKSLKANAQSCLIPVKHNRNKNEVMSSIKNSPYKPTDTLCVLGCSYNGCANVWLDNVRHDKKIFSGTYNICDESADSIFEILCLNFPNPFHSTNTLEECDKAASLNMTANELFENKGDILMLKRHIESHLYDENLLCRAAELLGTHNFNFSNVNQMLKINDQIVMNNLKKTMGTAKDRMSIQKKCSILFIEKTYIYDHIEFYINQDLQYSIRITVDDYNGNAVINTNPFMPNIKPLTCLEEKIDCLSYFISEKRAWFYCEAKEVKDLILNIALILNEGETNG